MRFMTVKRTLTPVAEVLASFLKRSGLNKRMQQTDVIERWGELVGPQIAAVSQPESVSAEGVLRVRVATAPWATELSLMTPRILARVNADREGRIKGIRWISE